MTAAADRMRKYRERQRGGIIPLSVDVHEINTVMHLVKHGFLTAETEDREKIAAALSRCWAWLTTPDGERDSVTPSDFSTW